MKDDGNDIFNLADEQAQPVAGSLLVAKPTVLDGYFMRSVVLLATHSEAEGSMGVVMNHFTGYMLGEVLEELDPGKNIPLYLGGPVGNDSIFYVHTLPPEVVPNSLALGDGLYFGGNYEAVRHYLEQGGPTVGVMKFMLGYSGWAEGQLADEVSRHDWAVLEHMPTAALMSDVDEEVWADAVAQFGRRYRLWQNWPVNPNDN